MKMDREKDEKRKKPNAERTRLGQQRLPTAPSRHAALARPDARLLGDASVGGSHHATQPSRELLYDAPLFFSISAPSSSPPATAAAPVSRPPFFSLYRSSSNDEYLYVFIFFIILFFPQTFLHGFPHQPTAVAFDPIQRVLAIGTKTGSLRMYPFVRAIYFQLIVVHRWLFIYVPIRTVIYALYLLLLRLTSIVIPARILRRDITIVAI